MTERDDQHVSSERGTPEEVTAEQYKQAYLALLEFATDSTEGNELEMADVWDLGRQIQTVIAAHSRTKIIEGASISRQVNQTQFNARNSASPLPSVTITRSWYERADNGINFGCFSMIIPTEFIPEKEMVESMCAYDIVNNEVMANHPFELAYDVVQPRPGDNARFRQIAQFLTSELLQNAQEPDGLFDEESGITIPDDFNPDDWK